LAKSKEGGSFHWMCPREEGHFFGRFQGRWRHFFGHVQRKRVILLAVPKGDDVIPLVVSKRERYHWPCPRENVHSLGRAQERMGHSLGRAQRRRGHFLIGRAQERTGPQCFLGLLNLGLSFILKLDHFNVLMLEMKF
jgi:hypothetical protein